MFRMIVTLVVPFFSFFLFFFFFFPYIIHYIFSVEGRSVKEGVTYNENGSDQASL